jgi:hypothetical protein
VRIALAVPALGAAMALAPLGGCGPPVDRAAVAAVQVTGIGESPQGCRLLGPLEGRDNDRWVPGGPRYETAMLDLRKKAVLGGGNFVAVDSITPPGDSDYNPTFVVKARLFACSGPVHIASASPVTSATPPRAAPPPAAPTPPRLCEPDCSPGYTCVRGTCVSACNPACTSGERCGADRICHPIASMPAPAPVPP